MANSITASNSSAPFNSLLLTDSNYNVSGTIATGGATSPSVNFNVASPYPTTANTIFYIWGTAQTTVNTFPLTLQESADNSTWNNVAIFANPILTVSSASNNISVIPGPSAKQYYRVSGSNSVGTPTGTFGLTVLM